MKNVKETYSREEVVDMLKEMQEETARCVGFFIGHVSQLWVIKDMLGKRIEALGGESIAIAVKTEESE